MRPEPVGAPSLPAALACGVRIRITLTNESTLIPARKPATPQGYPSFAASNDVAINGVSPPRIEENWYAKDSPV